MSQVIVKRWRYIVPSFVTATRLLCVALDWDLVAWRLCCTGLQSVCRFYC